ncbi:Na+/H+ antiporter subunit E [Pseudomonadota bacterium AL_CKDN230030165-1A_HGKHYDSX7]
MSNLPRRTLACVKLSGIFIRELVLSSWSVARAAFSREQRLQPAVIRYPLRVRSDLGIATLANLISLTPGTTSLQVSEDRTGLFIHCLDAASPPDIIEGIRTAFEDTILEIER